MHVEQVQFDEVFDVAGSRGDFSFRSAGRAWYGMNILGGTVPRSGSTFAIAFAEPGNWASVLGWRNLALPGVTLAESTASFLWSQAFQIILYGPFFTVGALVFGGEILAASVGAVIAGIAGYRTFRLMRRNRAVTRALLAVPGSAPRVDG